MSSLYYLNMKPITDYIFEEKLKYELSGDFEERTEGILSELVAALPGIPNVIHAKRGNYPDAEFWFNKWDLLRSQRIESSEFIGHPERLNLYIDTKKEKAFNVDVVKQAFEMAFDTTIKEGLFSSDNISKDLPEYSWVFGVYDGLSKFFKTKSFSGLKWNTDAFSFPASVFRELRNKPTVEKNNLMVSLFSINLRDLKPSYEFSKITITVIVYEKKDPAKIAEINNYNNNLKPLDVVGRELMVGDTVAYALMGGYGKYNGMQVGVVDSVSKEMVKVDGKSIRANRCCLISRKDGKRIE